MKTERIPQEVLSAEDRKNMDGFENTAIRYYFYLMKGLDIVNSFRNLFLGVIALYIALKLENIAWAIVMFVVSSILLTIAGHYNVHKVSKRHEWIGMRFSTTYGIKAFNFSQGQYDLLLEIRDLLKVQQKEDVTGRYYGIPADVLKDLIQRAESKK